MLWAVRLPRNAKLGKHLPSKGCKPPREQYNKDCCSADVYTIWSYLGSCTRSRTPLLVLYVLHLCMARPPALPVQGDSSTSWPRSS